MRHCTSLEQIAYRNLFTSVKMIAVNTDTACDASFFS